MHWRFAVAPAPLMWSLFVVQRCRSIAELRSVIVKARALALQEPERKRAAGDTRPTYILCPRPPAELALPEIGDPPLRQAA